MTKIIPPEKARYSESRHWRIFKYREKHAAVWSSFAGIENAEMFEKLTTYIITTQATSHRGRRNWGPANPQNSGVDHLHSNVPWCRSRN